MVVPPATPRFSPGDHRVAKAAHQVRVVAQLAEDPNGSEGSHCSAQYALHFGGLQELAVEPTLVRRQATEQHLRTWRNSSGNMPSPIVFQHANYWYVSTRKLLDTYDPPEGFVYRDLTPKTTERHQLPLGFRREYIPRY